MNPIVWVVLVCFIGALMGYLSKVFSGAITTWKQFGQDALTGIIAAAVFAGAYQFNKGSLTVLDVLASLVAGWGTVMGATTLKANITAKRAGTPYRNQMNQPK